MSLSAEQLQIRSMGIGGSEIAAVVGFSDYMRQIDVWQKKVETYHEENFDDNDNVLMGRIWERPILEYYSHKTGRRLHVPGTLVHPEHPIVRATPDAVVVGTPEEARVVEVKRPNWRSRHHWGAPGTDEIPKYYVPQTLWEMAVTGLDKADVLVSFGDAPKTYTVEWNQGLFDALLERAQEFWDEFVATGRPPPMDWSESCRNYLHARFPMHTDGVFLKSDPDMDALVARLRADTAELERVSMRVEQTKNTIKERIGPAEGIEGEWGRICWKTARDSKMIDGRALAAHLQVDKDTLDKFTKTRKGARRFTTSFDEE